MNHIDLSLNEKTYPAHLPLPAAYLPYGRLRVLFGNMFSGKTDELHRSYDRARHGHIPVQCFKSQLDKRDGATRTKSRRGRLVIPLATVAEANLVLRTLDPKTKLVILDEVQFFDRQILAVVQTLRFMGVDVIAAGLDLDYLGRPFGPTLELAAHATEAKKLTAICHKCRFDGAEYTQMINEKTGQEINWILDTNLGSPVYIEGASRYEARCGRCFVRPS